MNYKIDTKKIRKEKNITIDQLALISKVSRNTLLNIEAGGNISTFTFFKIAKNIGCDPRDLISIKYSKDIKSLCRENGIQQSMLLSDEEFMEKYQCQK